MAEARTVTITPESFLKHLEAARAHARKLEQRLGRMGLHS